MGLVEAMLFSQLFGVERSSDELWFDPILDFDTRLFIDPFLIFAQPTPPFETAHADIVSFSNLAFKLGAQTAGRTTGLRYQKLLDVLSFPEARELCLGYTELSTAGSGAGRGFSRVIAAGILESIAVGIKNISHFEEIGLLHEGIAHDRISDITANILKPQLVKYTQEVASRHGVELQRVRLSNARFDRRSLRWSDAFVKLPLNPFSSRGVLLVPHIFLRQLPTINPEDFWDYLWTSEGDRLRREFGYEVKRGVRKADIVRLARRERFLVRRYLEWVEGRPRAVPYDLVKDRKGVYQWESATGAFAAANPVSLVQATNHDEFLEVIGDIVEQFRHFIEQERGWQLLWNDDGTSKPERAGQLLFLGIVKHYCRANNIDFSREVETGRGPVDFKFASGYQDRALLEVKLASNGRFWQGLKKQLPTYLTASQIKDGYYLVIVYGEDEIQELSELQQIVHETGESSNTNLRFLTVNAIPGKVSASRV
jgi:hypothetical protein